MMRCAAAASLLVVSAICPAAAEAVATRSVAAYAVTGDAIEAPLAGVPGNAERGRALFLDRQRSLCLLCHAAPVGERRTQGTLAPDLAGVASRLSEGQIRLRVVDMKRLDPESIMPSYQRAGGFERVAPAWRGKPVLAAGEIEDIVAFLTTLED
jgi:sulfur-oxidizing protein SoxX